MISPEQIEIYREMTGEQRLLIGMELYEVSRELVGAGVQKEHPEWNATERKAEVIRRMDLWYNKAY